MTKQNEIDKLFRDSFYNGKADGPDDKSWDAIQQALSEHTKPSNFFKRNFASVNVYTMSIFAAAATTTAFSYQNEIRTFTAEFFQSSKPSVTKQTSVSIPDTLDTVQFAEIEDTIVKEVVTQPKIVTSKPKINIPIVPAEPEVASIIEIVDSIIQQDQQAISEEMIVAKPTQTPASPEKMYLKPSKVIVKDSVVQVVTKRVRKKRRE